MATLSAAAPATCSLAAAAAAGVSLEEYERTRASVMSVLGSSSSLLSASETASAADPQMTTDHATGKSTPSTTHINNNINQTKPGSSGSESNASRISPQLVASMNSQSAKLNIQTISRKSSATTTRQQLQQLANTSATPSESGPSTLRTSVSSTQTTNDDAFDGDFNSPPTSEGSNSSGHNTASRPHLKRSADTVEAAAAVAALRSSRSRKHGRDLKLDEPAQPTAPAIEQLSPSPASAANTTSKRSSGSAAARGSKAHLQQSALSHSIDHSINNLNSNNTAPDRITSSSSSSRPRMSTPPQHHASASSRRASSALKDLSGAIEDTSDSFSAATAAAAALGMLAASPVKAPAPSYTQHRGHANNNAGGSQVSSSSPPHGLLDYGLSSSTHSRHGKHTATSPVSYDSVGNLMPGRASPSRSMSGKSEGGKSTTPVRTRLEDIALKSSAQIRRTRERLGLAEDQEMMDLDEDARHESTLMRSSRMMSEDEDVEHAQFVPHQQHQQHMHSVPRSHRGPSANSHSLGPAFGHDDTDMREARETRGSSAAVQSSSASSSTAIAHAHPIAGRSGSSSPNHRSPSRTGGIGHRRGPSFEASRRMGMLDRFMETNASPKAAQMARFGSRNSSNPDDQALNSSFEDVSESTIHHLDGDLEDHSPPQQPQPNRQQAVQATPRSYPSSRAAYLRSAGNDLPSPLLLQIRQLNEPDYSSPQRRRTLYAEEAYRSPQPQQQQLRNTLAMSTGSQASAAGSARKRKAEEQLMSPRQRVINVETSPTDLHAASSPPPQYRQYPAQAARYLRSTPSHPHHAQSRDDEEGLLSQDQQFELTSSAARRYGTPSSAARSYHEQSPYIMNGPFEQSSPRAGQFFQSSQPTSDRSGPRSAASDYGTEELPVSTGKHYNQNMRGGQPGNGSPSMNRGGGDGYRGPAPQSPRSQLSAPRIHLKKTLSATSSTGSLRMSQDPASEPSASTTPGFDASQLQQSAWDARTKPPFSYAALIGQAIFSTPNNRMSLNDIYSYIMTVYPFYKKQDAGWQNSIRHNLSLNECFVKTLRGLDEPGKGCLWGIAAGTEEQFSNGNFYKKGKVPKPAANSRRPPGGPKQAPQMIQSSSTGSMNAQQQESQMKRKPRMASNANEYGDGPSMASYEDSYDVSMPTHRESLVALSQEPPLHQRPHIQQPMEMEHDHGAYHAQAYGYPQLHSQQHYPQQMRLQGPPPQMQPPQYQTMPPSRPQEFEIARPNSEDADGEVSTPRMDMQYNQSEALQAEQPDEDEEAAAAVSRDAPLLAAHRASRHVRTRSGISSLRHSTLAKPDGEDQVADEMPALNKGDETMQPSPEEPSVDNTLPEEAGSKASRYSPIRRPVTNAQKRNLLTSPPIMSSPPTNVFARMSQPYQPLRNAFRMPSSSSSANVAALMSSPPPSGIIAHAGERLRGLPPPTPRATVSLSNEDAHVGNSIFLPAVNIRTSANRIKKGAEIDDEDEVGESKPTLPPISMMSPTSALVSINTQSPISSIRASAATRSTSPSPKNAQLSHSSGSGSSASNRSPTAGKSRGLPAGDVFRTPDRFSTQNSSSRLPSPAKLAQLASNNASKALQSLTNSTPKLPGSRGPNNMNTPGYNPDPYEYGAFLDDEYERMSRQHEAETDRRPNNDRRSMHFPSPMDKTPKWQPWSPW